jgi:hypothetical protein
MTTRGSICFAVLIILSSVSCSKSEGDTSPDHGLPPTAHTLRESREPEHTVPTQRSEVGLADSTGSPYMATFGDVYDISLPEGQIGEVSVVSQGQSTDNGIVPVIVHNRVREDVSEILLTHEAVNPTGDYEVDTETAGYGRFLPHVVAYHEIAFGYVSLASDYSSSQEVDTPDFLIRHKNNVWDTPWFNWAPITVNEASLDGTTLTIDLTNQDENCVSELVVLMMCLDAS